MKFEPRQYQKDAVNDWWKSFADSPDNKPVIAVPTGAGKTVIMGMLIQQYIKIHPDNQVVVLSHTQDILEQDYIALKEFFPDDDIGLYSAGLKSKITNQITVAGIQSVHSKSGLFTWTNLFIIDECHTISHKNTGMYRTLLDSHPARIGGMSATVFRTGHGYIYENGGLFNTLAYDLTSISNFNKLVKDDYLTRLISKSTNMDMDVSKVKKTAGDYNIKSLGDTFDRDSITKEAVKEVIKYGKNYKKWLVFAIDTDHADNICDELISGGINAKVLHSKMQGDRTVISNDFKSGSLDCLVSVGMVTTGFDAPNVDLIVLLRPTMSAVLHVQMVGRGLRVAPKKDHCLVLDFAGNTERLGPINDVIIPRKGKKGKKSEAPVKKCPVCAALLPIQYRECDVCGHVFEFKTLLKAQVQGGEIVRESKNKWLTVNSVQYTKHSKKGKPNSIKVTYHCGMTTINDWVCPEHGGYAGDKAFHWLRTRGYKGSMVVDDIIAVSSILKKPSKILVDYTHKYPSIKNSIF